ncbi:glycoside hydrolase family 27 protein [Glycomyces dulcitolivorans]|uniref:glycoside hydrolase family 27 protein n=1 Tax=Glycomyces dulcitolivorans TaxID=2200759 RepID=UPI0018E51A07|nr:glycoside hydrolase family 27 protein [Glycomyces dulcitolivorans]
MTSTSARKLAAKRPPMGWNSWDCFGSSVTEDQVVANAEFMAAELKRFGWDTVVVDIQWYEPNPGEHHYNEVSDPVLDAWGRQLPAPDRFPSAADGSFKALADRVHALGLRFGVHMMRGIPKKAVELDLPVLGGDTTASRIADRDNVCTWNPDNFGIDHAKPGAQAYYDSQVAQLAEWGVDFVKLDDVLHPPTQSVELAAYSQAIDKCGRPIVLSLSPGKALSLAHLDALREHAEMWRISDDLWDDWSALLEMFQRAARWAPHQVPGAWGDADMLPLGRIGISAHVGEDRLSRLTFEEQRTMLTLWCMMRSPLMFGGHLPDTPAETLELLRNPEVLALLESKGGREIVRDHSLVVWRAGLDDAEACAVFWLGDEPADLDIHLADVGSAHRSRARDLWEGADVPVKDGLVRLQVPAHGVRLLRLE